MARLEPPGAASEELNSESLPIRDSGLGLLRSGQSLLLRFEDSKLLISGCVLVVAGLTLMRGIFAAVNPLRVDEAYYWTWSRESVISYLDHPPMIA
jgi:hypothetical protein